jgi:predicted transcriptional regulator
MRHRHALYLSEAMTQQLNAAAETHRVSKSGILERALQQYLIRQDSGQPNELQGLQYKATSRSLRRLERDLAITTELTATFVRYFLMITPPIPESEHAAVRAFGQLRFEQVVEEVARRLRTDRSLMARVMAKLANDLPQTASDNPGADDTDAAPPSEPIPRSPKPANGNG